MRRISKILSVVAAMALLVVLSPSAIADGVEIIDFDDIDLGGAPRNNFPALGIENTYRGYQWPSDPGGGMWAVVNNIDSQFQTVGAWSGEQAGWNWNGPETLSVIFDEDKIIDGAYFNVLMAEQSWGFDGVFMRGYDSNDDLIGTTDTLPLDDTSPSPAWGWLAADLFGVRRLEVVGVQGDPEWGDSGWWTMDDLTIRPVPEPTSLGLLIIGALATVRRRTR